jgi:cysteine dioxygenase
LDDVRDFVKFDPSRYRRNLVAEGPWYSLLVLCWRSGQRSPIHDHAQSACAFKVLTGVCSETVFGYSACGQVYPLHTEDRPVGSIVATQDADTHQVSNLQPVPRDLVTLHIYAPPLKSMALFSITGELVHPWSAAAELEAYEI